jgi:hypothetical protein
MSRNGTPHRGLVARATAVFAIGVVNRLSSGFGCMVLPITAGSSLGEPARLRRFLMQLVFRPASMTLEKRLAAFSSAKQVAWKSASGEQPESAKHPSQRSVRGRSGGLVVFPPATGHHLSSLQVRRTLASATEVLLLRMVLAFRRLSSSAGHLNTKKWAVSGEGVPPCALP